MYSCEKPKEFFVDFMRIIKLSFIAINIFIVVCFGQDRSEQDFPSTPIKSLFAHPQQYNKKSISIVGVLDLSHFENANINGIKIDWACYDPTDPHTGELSWKRWDAWKELGIHGKYAEITGSFVFFEAGSFAPWKTFMISKIQEIRIINNSDSRLENNPYLVMKCDVLRTVTER
jgi:hypothetical protein